MDLRELKIQFLNAKVVTDDIKVIFRTPDCYTYYDCNCHIAICKNKHVLMIDLIDKTKPTFKIGDKVTNISGLFPEVGYTIVEVNEEEQYYTYKEIHGRTYFKDQNKLILVKSDNSTTPVEDETKFAESILDAIKAVRTTKLKGSINFNIPKNIDTFKLGCKLSYNEDLNISAELSNNGTDVITVKW